MMFARLLLWYIIFVYNNLIVFIRQKDTLINGNIMSFLYTHRFCVRNNEIVMEKHKILIRRYSGQERVKIT